ncbi:release factor glutamine methyltransferase [Pseudonocardia eucalypti]|nr:release factor glutamine methyltransferase [Pseudonocardia eucalypti]
MGDLVTMLRAAGCVFAEEEARLITEAAGTPGELAAMARRRSGGEPLEQVLGWAEFAGLRIALTPGVFVPRRRTERLVDRAVEVTAETGAVVVDLCCGSGAIGAALTARLGRPELYAVDIDPSAVDCARHNLPGARVYLGDLYEPLPAGLRGRVNLLVANVPYVPTGAIPLLPPEARLHEPRTALDGGADGLDVLRRVAAEAPRWLAPGGHVLFEVGEEQVGAATTAIALAGLAPAVARDADSSGAVVLGTAPNPAAEVPQM